MPRVEIDTTAPDFEPADFTGHRVLKLFGQRVKIFKPGRLRSLRRGDGR